MERLPISKRKLLILGGTTEARRLAERLADDGRFATLLSLAGRTADPAALPVAVRIGGFGGAEGLAAYMLAEKVEALIVATHPYAARIAENAAFAAKATGVPALRLLRPAWEAVEGDLWHDYPDLETLVDAIGAAPRRVFVTTGRQGAFAFERAPQHHYLFRSVDPIDPPLALPKAAYILDRGPYDVAAEVRLMRERGIELLVSKNSGGAATHAKIAAARTLGIPVALVARPQRPDIAHAGTVDAVLAWLDHGFGPAKRGE